MKKIIFIIGTRPEGIKLAPVINEVKKHQNNLVCLVLVTGQHKELLNQVLELFEIKPDFNLKIMTVNQTLQEVFSKVLEGVTLVLKNECPNLVIVQGDTITAVASALASFYEKIPVVHVEAGLRTYDSFQPFPEEINRTLISHLADFNFCPTNKNARNLLNEGINKNKIMVTGNTVIDTLTSIVGRKGVGSEELKKIDFSKKIILVTAHRRENFGNSLINLCLAIKDICKSKNFNDIEFVWPVHPNPNVKIKVNKILGKVPGVKLINPLDYYSFCLLMKKSYIIITDSGGIQEEAPSFHKPLLIFREKTERVEIVEKGGAVLVESKKEKIIKELSILLNDPKKYEKMSKIENPYGDGKASKRIVKWILEYFENNEKNSSISA